MCLPLPVNHIISRLPLCMPLSAVKYYRIAKFMVIMCYVLCVRLGLFVRLSVRVQRYSKSYDHIFVRPADLDYGIKSLTFRNPGCSLWQLLQFLATLEFYNTHTTC